MRVEPGKKIINIVVVWKSVPARLCHRSSASGKRELKLWFDLAQRHKSGPTSTVPDCGRGPTSTAVGENLGSSGWWRGYGISGSGAYPAFWTSRNFPQQQQGPQQFDATTYGWAMAISGTVQLLTDSLKSLRRSGAFRSAIRACCGASGCPLEVITNKGRRKALGRKLLRRSVDENSTAPSEGNGPPEDHQPRGPGIGFPQGRPAKAVQQELRPSWSNERLT